MPNLAANSQVQPNEQRKNNLRRALDETFRDYISNATYLVGLAEDGLVLLRCQRYTLVAENLESKITAPVESSQLLLYIIEQGMRT